MKTKIIMVIAIGATLPNIALGAFANNGTTPGEYCWDKVNESAGEQNYKIVKCSARDALPRKISEADWLYAPFCSDSYSLTQSDDAFIKGIACIREITSDAFYICSLESDNTYTTACTDIADAVWNNLKPDYAEDWVYQSSSASYCLERPIYNNSDLVDNVDNMSYVRTEIKCVCDSDYYNKNGGTGKSMICDECPHPGQSKPYNTDGITSCYIAKDTTAKDSTGTYTYTNDCYWKD